MPSKAESKNIVRFTNAIATRQFERTDTGDSVIAELGAPQRDGRDFACPYRITGLGRKKIGVAYGVDGMQAVQMAMEALRIRLEPHAAKLAFFGEVGETFFSPLVPISFGIEFRRRIEALISRELGIQLKSLEERAASTTKKKKRKSRPKLRAV